MSRLFMEDHGHNEEREICFRFAEGERTNMQHRKLDFECVVHLDIVQFISSGYCATIQNL